MEGRLLLDIAVGDGVAILQLGLLKDLDKNPHTSTTRIMYLGLLFLVGEGTTVLQMLASEEAERRYRGQNWKLM